MIRLLTLGVVGLEDPERPELPQLLHQPKAFAFLCYLALAGPPRFRRRDAAIALFWPEVDHEHGRAALRQTLSVLRRFLGADAIVNRGDEEIGLDHDRIWCDAEAFEELSDAGEAAQAMALYRGDLIEALHVAGAAPELSQWLDSERGRLRRRAQEMVWLCVEESRGAGDTVGAIRWARRAIQLEPFDERGLRSLLQLLDQAGERASAVQEYEQFAVRLEQELEVRPAVETQSLIASIRARLPVAPPAQPTKDSEKVASAAPGHSSPQRLLRRPRPFYTRRSLLLVSLFGLALAFVLAAKLRRERPVALRPNLVAIMPWRVSGADPSLAYLREGMLDLLDGTLTGDRGLHAADPRTVLGAVNAVTSPSNQDVPLAAAMAIARQIGAGRVLQGAVVGTPAHLTIQASEFSTPSSRSILTFGVTGSIDSLPQMVERLTAQLLAHETSEPEHVQSLATTSLPALRAYLEGRAAFRRGRYGEATHRFGQALALDSTLTLAALGLSTGSYTMEDIALIQEGRRLAWRDSSRLSPRDRALLIDVIGPSYPGPSDERGYLAARQRAVVLAPESPEAAYWLGDSFFHHGRLLGLPDWRGRSIAAFERAIKLDSTYPEPYQHLIEIKLQQGDTTGVRALAATYFAMDSGGEYRDFVRWRVAVGLADSAGLKALREQFRGMSTESLFRIAEQSQVEGIALSDAERAASSLATQAGDDGRWTTAAYVMEGLASNQGRPAAALAATAFMTADRRRPLADRWFRVADAIYTDGDSIAAERAIHEMTPRADGPTQIRPGAADSQNVATCAVAVWRMHRADTLHVRSAIRRLRNVPPAKPSGFGVWMNACATILEAQLAAQLGTSDTLTALIRLDSLADAGPDLASPLRVVTTLVLAHLQEQRGNLPAALAAVRRRENEYSPRYLSSQLVEEGRLAALVGERAAAIRAYQHYLILRANPEPSLQPKVDSIRAVLASLQRANH